MSVPAVLPEPAPSRIGAWRTVVLALRELRWGLGGFYVFIACVALGVAVITGVGALGDALRNGFERQGETILGGDAALSRIHTRATPAERAWFESQGRVSETATLRSMAHRLDGEDSVLIEVKAVDTAYPLVGGVPLAGANFDTAVRSGDVAAVDPMLLERLGLALGDRIKIGSAEITVRATVVSEPDGIVDRLTYGPRVFVSFATLEKTGLVQPGSLVRYRYALKLTDPAAGADGLVAFRARVKSALPEAGFSVVDRRDPSPQVTRTLERLRQFLTMLGLTALLVGGVGVANAVATFIDRRRAVIATMKSLGATGRNVFSLFLVQVMAMAAVGVAIGLGLGQLIPIALTALYGDLLPIETDITVSAASLVTGAAYGFLVALLFALWPLGRAELVRASVLFRDEVAPARVWPRPRIVILTALAAAVLIALALYMSDSKRIALYFCAGLVVSFAIFIALGAFVTWLAGRVRRPRRPEFALAIGNLASPGGLTRSVTLSLGAGLTLLVAVALADASLVEEITGRIPENSPNFFVLDIPKADYEAVEKLVVGEAPGTKMVSAPMLRGRMVAINGTNVEELKVPPEAQWVLRGDRGLTYDEKLPAGSTLTQGTWWPADYQGEPLVSFESDLARHLGLKIGDQVTVNVLGRNLTARVANLREVKWESLNLNFVMVFSPNALKSAPHNLLATVSLPSTATLPDEAKVARAIGKAFPALTVIRVKDALDAFQSVFGKVMTAVRVAGSVTLLAGALVLAGALATAQRRRVLEAVILKVLGATRRRVLLTHFSEYLILATVTAVFAVILGTIAAWVAVSQVMEIEFNFAVLPIVQALALAIGLVALFGGLGTWAVLRARPVPYLRSE